MSFESIDGAIVPPGAAFVASTGGEVYHWVGGREWHAISPLHRVWFPNEQAAKEAGYRPSSATFERLEDFEILGEIGRGATSIVYRARDRELGREVAIKVIQTCFRDDSENEARFAQEARLLAGLRHPNIVSAFSVKRLSGGGLALIMEYVRGRTLREVVSEEGPLPIERVEGILHDVGEALAAAHRDGIVHRDVKPDNIFLEEGTGRALLADFGIAMHLDNPSGLTIAGTAVGTPNYMSPEQIDGHGVDARSDLYSLALIGWEMLTGRRPWDGEGLYSVIYKQKHEELPSVRDLRPDVPDRLANAIEGGLTKDAGDRWGSADALLSRMTDEPVHARGRRGPAAARGRPARPRRNPHLDRRTIPPAELVPTVHFRRSALSVPAAAPVEAPTPPSPVRRRRYGTVVAIALVGLAALAIEPFAAPGPGDQDAGERTSGSDNGAAAGEGAQPASPEYTLPDWSLAFETIRARGDSDETTELPADPLPGPPTAAAPSRPVEDEAPMAAAANSENPASTAASLPFARSRSRIAAGGMHSCGIDSAGELFCWGGSDAIPGGARDLSQTSLPLVAQAVGSIQGVEAGGFHTCALSTGGTAICWGENSSGQLGAGPGVGSGPVRVASNLYYSLSLGTAHTCGLARDGQAYCWGSNEYGQLGNGTRTYRNVPTRVVLNEALAAVAAGWDHTCALTSLGEVLCWGRNDGGQLGDGTTSSRSTPRAVSRDLSFRSITAGSAHSCALTGAGEAYCWGQNEDGRLGDGTFADRRGPTPVRSAARFVEISAGSRHTCGLALDGTAFCWGQNNYGQLGIGGTQNQPTPARVQAEVAFTTVRSSGAHTCAVGTDGAAYCWGYNVEGQVGDGTRTHRTVPTRVERTSAIAS